MEPRQKVVQFPSKKTNREKTLDTLRELSEDTTILIVWDDGKEYDWFTESGKISLNHLLGTLDLVKRDMIEISFDQNRETGED